MPTIRLSKAHSKPLPEVRELADNIALKLNEDYDVSSSWSGDDCVNFKRSGLKGNLKITDSSVDIYLDLSFLLAGFKSMIEKRVKEQLDKALS